LIALRKIAKTHRFVPLIAPHTKPREALQVRAWVEIEPGQNPTGT
jgi:hypothetical protein